MTWSFRTRQALTIARLELRRVFFAKRSLWVYLLALFPLLPFTGHGLSVTWRQQRWATQVTPREKLETVAEGQTLDEVRRALGKPLAEGGWTDDDDKVEHRWMNLYDGRRRHRLYFRSGILHEFNSESLVDFDQDRAVYASMFQHFYLRLAIFFGCLGIFMNLFRGEMLDKTLHYWLLAPVRRETLLAGKYLAGLAASSLIFAAGTALCFYGTLWYQDAAELRNYWSTQGPSHLIWYVATAALACVGYGSVFLAAGLLVRNPIVPAAVLLVWESIHGFLPAMLQKFSVLYYVQSICPVPAVPLDDGAPALVRMLLAPSEPAPAWQAAIGLGLVTLLVLWAAARAVRRLELQYGTD